MRAVTGMCSLFQRHTDIHGRCLSVQMPFLPPTPLLSVWAHLHAIHKNLLCKHTHIRPFLNLRTLPARVSFLHIYTYITCICPFLTLRTLPARASFLPEPFPGVYICMYVCMYECMCVCVFWGGREGAARVRIGILARGLKVQRESRVRAGGGGGCGGEQHTIAQARTLTHVHTQHSLTDHTHTHTQTTHAPP